MNRTTIKLLVVVAFTLSLVVQGSASVKTKDIVVEFPSDLPEVAQHHSEGMFMYPAGDEERILYLEQDQGRTLAMLDVSDPGKIRSLGQVSLNAPAAFEFVQYLGHGAELIHYRNHSGFATISFKDFRKPTLRADPRYLRSARVQMDGPDALLMVSSADQSPQVLNPQYEVVSVSNPANPAPLATIQGVIQRVESTGNGPNTLPVLNLHVDRGQSLANFTEPTVICLWHPFHTITSLRSS